MRSVSDELSTGATEIDGIRPSGPESNFRPELFGQVARLVWPDKTDAMLASIAGKSDRSARFWLSGEVQAPLEVYLALVAELSGIGKQR
jgi:hypothetical protein